MKTADEMFLELGYKKFNKKHDFENIKYYKDKDNILYFDETDKSFYKSGEYDSMCDDITMQELQAINKKVEELRMDLEPIFAEIKNLTTGIYYKQFKKLVKYISKIPYEQRDNYIVRCKEEVYRECKKIADYFGIKTIKSDYLPEDILMVLYKQEYKNI